MADNDQSTEDPKDNKLTEDQVKSANELEQAKWEGDFNEDQLAIPYAKDEAAAEETTETEETDQTEEAEPVETTEYIEPAPVVTVQDPGVYTPKDYSFEVILKDGKSVKITTPEEAETIAEDPDNFNTPKQLLDFIRKAQRMETKLEQDREKWEDQKQQHDDQLKQQNNRTETINSLASEFNYLVDKGLLPAVDPQYLTANWQDPQVAKQPGVKEQVALLDYMVKENEQRAKSGVKPLTSALDAYNAWKLDQTEQQAEADKKAEAEARKAAGARVAGISASNQGAYVPKGIAVGNPNVLRRGGSSWED